MATVVHLTSLLGYSSLLLKKDSKRKLENKFINYFLITYKFIKFKYIPHIDGRILD